MAADDEKFVDLEMEWAEGRVPVCFGEGVRVFRRAKARDGEVRFEGARLAGEAGGVALLFEPALKSS